MYNYHTRGDGNNASNRGSLVKGLIATLSVSLVAGLEGCRADGSPDFDIAPDPLSHLAAPLGRGIAPIVAERAPVSGAVINGMADEYGRQQAAKASRSVPQVNVYQSAPTTTMPRYLRSDGSPRNVGFFDTWRGNDHRFRVYYDENTHAILEEVEIPLPK